MSTLALRRAEVGGVVVDVGVEDANVVALGPPGSLTGATREIDCAGGALVPGLHDHHLHLLAMAAALDSVDVSRGFDDTLKVAHARTLPGAWIRATGYDEMVSGTADRWRLDALAPGRPLRVQHRSGSMWVLSTAALEATGGLESEESGIERDVDGRPTGRLFRLDGWLHDRISDGRGPDLDSIGGRLASFGVTGVTDCTPTTSPAYLQTLSDAVHDGALPLTVTVTGGPELSEAAPPGGLSRGPVKVVVADHALPELSDLVAWFRRAHRVPRPVAVHCVTRSALVLALAAWSEAGSVPGDRIEHASVTPAELMTTLAGHGIAVVTQPAFVMARGDAYLRNVDPDDRPDLYRCASLLESGVEVGGSTDAPFGPDDPWIAMRAAVERRSALGARVGLDPGLDASRALELFLGHLSRPGGPPRHVEVGAPADLCLLDCSMNDALRDLSSRHVAMTIASGVVSYAR